MDKKQNLNKYLFVNCPDAILSTTFPITLGGIKLKTLTNDNASIPTIYLFFSSFKNHPIFLIIFIKSPFSFS